MYVSEFAMIFLNFSKLSSMLLLVLPFPNGVRLFSHSGEFAQIKFGAQFWLSDCLEIRFKIRGHFFKCFELQMFWGPKNFRPQHLLSVWLGTERLLQKWFPKRLSAVDHPKSRKIIKRSVSIYIFFRFANSTFLQSEWLSELQALFGVSGTAFGYRNEFESIFKFKIQIFCCC